MGVNKRLLDGIPNTVPNACPMCGGDLTDDGEYQDCTTCGHQDPTGSHEAQPERFYTVAEIAARLRVEAVTVRRWIRSGKLKAFRLPGGREIRVPWRAIAALLTDAREVPEGLREQGELIGQAAKDRARKRRRRPGPKAKRGRKK